jgi:hypothetical protein
LGTLLGGSIIGSYVDKPSSAVDTTCMQKLEPLGFE